MPSITSDLLFKGKVVYVGSSSMAIDIGIFNENDKSPVLSSVFTMVARSADGPFKLTPLPVVDPADQVDPLPHPALSYPLVILIKQSKAQAAQRLRSKRGSTPPPLTAAEHEYIHNLFTVFAKVRHWSH